MVAFSCTVKIRYIRDPSPTPAPQSRWDASRVFLIAFFHGLPHTVSWCVHHNPLVRAGIAVCADSDIVSGVPNATMTAFFKVVVASTDHNYAAIFSFCCSRSWFSNGSQLSGLTTARFVFLDSFVQLMSPGQDDGPASMPLSRCDERMRLCRCSLLYHRIKWFFAGLGKSELTVREAGKIGGHKHTLHHNLLSPCILLILPLSGQADALLPIYR